MIVPSNDAWASNGNPMAYPLTLADGEFQPLDVTVLGTDVIDAGTELNDELPENTPLLGMSVPGTGVDTPEGPYNQDHGGFNPVGSGGILDDERFVNADFTAEGYEIFAISVTEDDDGHEDDGHADMMATATESVPKWSRCTRPRTPASRPTAVLAARTSTLATIVPPTSKSTAPRSSAARPARRKFEPCLVVSTVPNAAMILALARMHRLPRGASPRWLSVRLLLFSLASLLRPIENMRMFTPKCALERALETAIARRWLIIEVYVFVALFMIILGVVEIDLI